MPRTKSKVGFIPNDEDHVTNSSMNSTGANVPGLEPDMHAFVEVVRLLKFVESDLRWAVLEAVDAFFRKLDRRGRDD
jgi:hypothetical protein